MTEFTIVRTDDKIKTLVSEKEDLSAQVRSLAQKVEDLEQRAQLAEKFASPKRENSKTPNGPLSEADSSELNSKLITACLSNTRDYSQRSSFSIFFLPIL